GSFTVRVTDATGCTGTSDSVNVIVHPLPVQPIILINATLLTVSNANSALNYQWLLNGEIISAATSPEYQAQESGLYTVRATDINGCSQISEPVAVLLSKVAEFSEKFSLKIYPNPSNGIFTISGLFKNTVEISLSNLSGENQFTYMMEPDGERIFKTVNIEHLPSGIYFLKISSGLDEMIVKIVKE
ncbi:MAG TPA: T9SS type A sorting domain-containing protein, partial [Patescibacteria group bacterium]|nr:T9SS type A sorting domain-containing protein [Patescibacteria group bacterium]